MKGSADSASSSKLGWVLPQAKKLFWSADGTTNLPEWKGISFKPRRDHSEYTPNVW